MIVHDAAATFVDLIDAALWWFATSLGTVAFVAAVVAVTFALQPPKVRRGAQASRGAPQPASPGSGFTETPPVPAQSRTARRVPAWAHTDHHHYKETA